MKSKTLRYIIFAFIIILLILFIPVIKKFKGSDEVYLLYGGNQDIETKNGYIVKSNESVTMNLGSFHYYIHLDDIEIFTMSIYKNSDEKKEKESIFTKSIINMISGSNSAYPTNGTPIGTIEENFTKDEFNEILNNLYLSVEYTDSNDRLYESSFKINLEKIN